MLVKLPSNSSVIRMVFPSNSNVARVFVITLLVPLIWLISSVGISNTLPFGLADIAE